MTSPPHALIARMTDRAREVLTAAQLATGECAHASLQAPHVVLGILADPRTEGAQALQHGGLTYRDVLEVVSGMYERRPEAGDALRPVCHETGMLLRGAQREARALEHESIGTAHLALACTRDDGVTSIGPIVAGRQRIIRSAALGLLTRAERLAAASVAAQGHSVDAPGQASMQELLFDPPDHLRSAKVVDLLVSVPRVGGVRVARLLAQCAISPAGPSAASRRASARSCGARLRSVDK